VSLWDELPAGLRDTGAVDGLEPLLDNLTSQPPTERTEPDGTWKIWQSTLGDSQPLSFDPSAGGFRRGAGTGSTPLEFPDPTVDVELGLRLTGPGGDPDGTVRVIVETPGAVLRIPQLRGAQLDAQGQLRPDPANPVVRFLLPALRVRVLRPAGGAVGVSLLSAATGPAQDHIYDFVRMEPPHALVGPGTTVGFAFRAAVLDLSGTAGPSGVPPEARTMPAEWQGLWLPEVRLFVAPDGLEGLAVSAGVRDLWIGIGRHEGVTGVFEAEVVNRGADPKVRLRFQTPTGEWIGVPDTDPVATPVDLPETSRLYVDAGGGLAPLRSFVTVGSGAEAETDRADVTTPATGTVSISVRVTDAGSHTVLRSISVRRRPPPPGGATTPAPGPATVATATTTGSRLRIVAQTDAAVTVGLEPSGGTLSWSWTGGGAATGETAVIPLAAGATVTVTATRSRPAASPVASNCYMLFDKPAATSLTEFAENPDKTRTQPAETRDGFGSAPRYRDPANRSFLTALPPATAWTVEGFASYEGDDSAGQRERNQKLSARRRDVLVSILQEFGFTSVTTGTAHGHAPAKASTVPGSGEWWRATATGTLPAAADETVTGTVTRPPVPTTPPPAPEDRDPAPTKAPVPDCFRRIGVRVELLRGTFIRAEVYGEFDVHTAAEQRLSASSSATPPARTNPNDGICAFFVRLRIAEDRSSWDVTADFRAVEADLDGLAKWESGTGSQTALNIVGAVAALSPLLAAATPPSPTAGELVPMVIAGAAAVGIGASGVMATRYVILRGGELMVTDGLVDPASGTGPRTTQVSVLLDVETAFTFDLGFVHVDPAKPVTARYKAVGVRSTWTSAPQPDGTVRYAPLPVFDPSRGYTLDIPTGSLVAGDPLGDVLRVLGVRISRDNPTYLEVEVGMGVDLGIVHVDTARVRLRLDASETPQLTKLGASIDVPGTLHGSGYVEITPAGFKGAFDLTITPLNLRVAAFLAVETRDGVTGVLVGAEVEFPVPLPLGNSGLALYGFLGGVGVNYARKELPGPAPALGWLEQQLGPARGSVMHPDGWEHRAGNYAFAAGVLLGTAEGGFVLHLKGIVLIEVPGPRLLLVMKADVLKLPPVLKSQQSATFLAMLDLDFGRGTITIGVVAEYSVERLVRIRIPVTAFFNTNQPEQWFVDLGTFSEPVTVEVLDVFRGVGYLMVHGDGMPAHGGLPAIAGGLAIAVGFHIECVLMGSKAIGLYLEAAAGFDALVSFDPFFIGGKIYVRGELRLFIVSIGASAELTVLVDRQGGNERIYIHGKVCGSVDFFFFSVEGCVSLEINDPFTPAVPAPDLVGGVSLVSRTPALVEGTATDRAVDGKLADGVAAGAPDPLPTVPLDAIPVVLFRTAPLVAPGNVVLGGQPLGANGLGANPWVRLGDRWWRYRVTSVELDGPLQPAAGLTPSSWWARGAPGDPQHGPALALLNWLPTPTPNAIPYGERLTEIVEERWGEVCTPVARPAPVLWTFDGKPVGPSPVGWSLPGVPWPDPPGTVRSSSASAALSVSERWRTGNPLADLLQGTSPAVVVGDAVACPAKQRGERTIVDSVQDWAAGDPGTFGRVAGLTRPGGVQDAVDLLAGGTSLADLAAAFDRRAWDPELGRRAIACEGRILRAPALDSVDPAPEGTEADRELVLAAREKAGFKPSPLEDSIALRTDSAFERLTALLLVPRGTLEMKWLVLRFLDGKAQELGRQHVHGGDLVHAGRPVPADWTDPSGPWADPVERAGRIAARVAAATSGKDGSFGGVVLVLVHAEVPGGTAAVELGWDRETAQVPAPAFYVVAAEGLVTSEVWRFEWDESSHTKDREALESVLTQDPDDHALLVPGATYTVRVRWEAESKEQEAQPAATAPESFTAQPPAEYRFQADPATEAPKDLDPWVLASSPSMNETGVLCREPIRIALATQNTTALFAAYGEQLEVVVRAASGHHPAPPGGGPGDAIAVPLAVGALGSILKPAPEGLAVTSPFEQAVGELVGRLTCVEGAGGRTHHSVIEIPYDLEPLTDYLIDVMAVRTSGGTRRRVHRIGFTTSRFGTVGELADLVRLGTVGHWVVENPAALAALPPTPTGDQLDAAFQAARLSVPTVPRYPKVEVLWSPAAVPEPVAVMVECSESMWRSRPMPTKVSGPLDAVDPAHQWWAAVRRDWLFLAPSGAPVAAGDPARATIASIVRGPGGTRAIVLLAGGSRGREVRLDLVLAADELAGSPESRAEAVRLAMLRAPWEVED
jgi:large repetitive protein